MIAASRVQRVRSLLAEGHSQRKIATLTGVSRGTISAIASGKRSEPVRRSGSDDIAGLGGPPERCPGCGGMVQMPCRLCSCRATKQRAAVPSMVRWLGDLDEPLGLNLRDRERRRYEKVHARKVRETCEELAAALPEPADARHRMCRLDPEDLRDALEPDDDGWLDVGDE